MARELFTLAQTAEGTATRITCQCGATDDFYFSRSKLDPAALPGVFARRGWRVGRNAHRHKCPDCLNAKHQSPEPESMPMAKDAPPVIVPQPGASELPPRQMSREDGQIVFAKLSEVYLGESTGYSSGWHDQRVATDLNCPRKWVEDIREQFFGPVKADQSPEVIQLTERLDALERAAHSVVDSGVDAVASAFTAKERAESARAKAETILKDVAGIRADLRALTGRAS